tara:strand:- start:14068 stop:14325 length:258 start_codon:yes stop_codon:yes gene_type:complete
MSLEVPSPILPLKPVSSIENYEKILFLRPVPTPFAVPDPRTLLVDYASISMIALVECVNYKNAVSGSEVGVPFQVTGISMGEETW